MSDPEVIERKTPMEIGRDQAIEFLGAGNERYLDKFVRDAGIYSLTYLIERVLDKHYPADIFGNGSILVEVWASNEGGNEFDPGVKWVAFLRHAIAQVKT